MDILAWLTSACVVVHVCYGQDIIPHIWTVDKEPTNKVRGIEFFHAKQPEIVELWKLGDVTTEKQTDKKDLNTFSHFMPDKLSNALKLSHLRKSRNQKFVPEHPLAGKTTTIATIFFGQQPSNSQPKPKHSNGNRQQQNEPNDQEHESYLSGPSPAKGPIISLKSLDVTKISEKKTVPKFLPGDRIDNDKVKINARFTTQSLSSRNKPLVSSNLVSVDNTNNNQNSFINFDSFQNNIVGNTQASSGNMKNINSISGGELFSSGSMFNTANQPQDAPSQQKASVDATNLTPIWMNSKPVANNEPVLDLTQMGLKKENIPNSNTPSFGLFSNSQNTDFLQSSMNTPNFDTIRPWNGNAFDMKAKQNTNVLNDELIAAVSDTQPIKPFPFAPIDGQTRPKASNKDNMASAFPGSNSNSNINLINNDMKAEPEMSIKQSFTSRSSINRAGPSMKMAGEFIDQSSKPIFRVKTKFVDLSGRQKPGMKIVGGFVDLSNEFKKERPTITSEVPPSLRGLAPPDTGFVDLTMQNVQQGKERMTVPMPTLQGIALPGVLNAVPAIPTRRANTVTTGTHTGISGSNGGKLSFVELERNKPENVGQYSTTTVAPDVTTRSQAVSTQNNVVADSNRGNKADTLQVDNIYPPVPFPINNNVNFNDNSGTQNTNINGNKLSNDAMSNTAANIPVNTINTHPEIANMIGQGFVDLAPNTNSNKQGSTVNISNQNKNVVLSGISVQGNGGGSNTFTQNTLPNITRPVMTNVPTGNIDKLQTDPNVQVINPNGQFDKNGQLINQNARFDANGQFISSTNQLELNEQVVDLANSGINSNQNNNLIKQGPSSNANMNTLNGGQTIGQLPNGLSNQIGQQATRGLSLGPQTNINIPQNPNLRNGQNNQNGQNGQFISNNQQNFNGQSVANSRIPPQTRIPNNQNGLNSNNMNSQTMMNRNGQLITNNKIPNQNMNNERLNTNAFITQGQNINNGPNNPTNIMRQPGTNRFVNFNNGQIADTARNNGQNQQNVNIQTTATGTGNGPNANQFSNTRVNGQQNLNGLGNTNSIIGQNINSSPNNGLNMNTPQTTNGFFNTNIVNGQRNNQAINTGQSILPNNVQSFPQTSTNVNQPTRLNNMNTPTVNQGGQLNNLANGFQNTQQINAQNGQINAQNGQINAQNGQINNINGPNNFQNGQSNIQNRQTNFQNGPNQFQNPLNSVQSGLNIPQNILQNNFQNGLNNFQNGPNNFQNGPNNFQNGPNNFINGPNSIQNGPNNFQNGPNNFLNGQMNFANNRPANIPNNVLFNNPNLQTRPNGPFDPRMLNNRMNIDPRLVNRFQGPPNQGQIPPMGFRG